MMVGWPWWIAMAFMALFTVKCSLKMGVYNQVYYWSGARHLAWSTHPLNVSWLAAVSESPEL